MLSWDWVTAWWRVYGIPDRRLAPAIWVKEEEGRLVALFPLYRIGNALSPTNTLCFIYNQDIMVVILPFLIAHLKVISISLSLISIHFSFIIWI